MVSTVATPDSEAMTSAASPGMSCSSRKSSTMMPSTVGPAWMAVRRSVVRMRRPILTAYSLLGARNSSCASSSETTPHERHWSGALPAMRFWSRIQPHRRHVGLDAVGGQRVVVHAYIVDGGGEGGGRGGGGAC